MKKSIYSMMMFSMLVMFTGCEKNKGGIATADKSIVVLYDNDVHCGIEGYVQMAGLRDAVSAADTSYVLTTSSGDFVQGKTPGVLSKGEYPVRMINSVGYDVVTLGNHEFDYLVPRQKELIQMLTARVTCANFTEAGSSKLICEPYVMKRFGKRKVAFVGVLTPDAITDEYYAFYDDNDKLIYDINKEKIVQMTQSAVDKARKAGANYVILLSHIGVEEGKYKVTDLIAATSGIDAVLDGHSHTVIPHEYALNKKGRKVLYTQTGTQFENIGKLLISKNGSISSTLLPVKDIVEKSARVQVTLDSVNKLVDEVAGRKVGYSEVLLTINGADGKRAVRKAETNAGDFVADSYRIIGDAEIGVVNGGGVRTDVPVGDITYKNLIDVSPFCNTLDVAEFKGSDILKMLTESYKLIPAENGSFLQISGMKCVITLSSDGNKVSDVEVLDKASGKFLPLDPEREYIVCTTGYMIDTFRKEAGVNCNILKTGIMTDNEATTKYVTDVLKGRIGKEYENSQMRILIKN